MRRLRADATAAILAAGLAFLPLRAAAGPAVASPGGTWLRYPLPGAEVKSLAAEPRAPGLFYAGTALGGVYRSTDGGRSWTAPPGGAPFPGYSVTSTRSASGRSGPASAASSREASSSAPTTRRARGPS